MLNRDQAWDGRVVEVRPNGTFEFDGVPQGEPVHLRVGDIEVPLVVVHDIENITIPLD